MEYRGIGEDDRYDALVQYLPGQIVGRPPNQSIKFNSQWLSKYTTWQPLGKKRESVITRNTGPYRPGRIKLTPAVHFLYNCGSSPGSCDVLTTITGSTKTIMKLQGHLAAHAVICVPAYPSTPDSAELQQKLAFTSAIADYKSAELDVGMMLAEAGETIGMLISPFTVLPKLCKKLVRPRTFRRPAHKKVGSIIQYASDAWLQYRYAILPTVCDVDAIRNTTRSILEPRHVDYAKSRVLKVFDESGSRAQINGVRPIPASLFGHYTLRTEHVARATAFYRVENQPVGARLGVDLTSIPSLAWELIPGSFIFDWFVDVSTWLRAITPKSGIMSLGGYTSVTSETTMSIAVNYAAYSGPSSYYPLSPVTSSMVATSVKYVRSLATSPVEYPPLNPNLSSWKRQLDLATLSTAPLGAILNRIFR